MSQQQTPARAYNAQSRQQKAGERQQRILDAAKTLLSEVGFEDMTVDAIAAKADVAPATVYAAFRSKKGILQELLNRVSFGSPYLDLVEQAKKNQDPYDRLRYAAKIAQQIYDAQKPFLDLLCTAGIVSPELAAFEIQLGQHRHNASFQTAELIARSGKAKPHLSLQEIHEILWSITGPELYRNLVQKLGWESQRYQELIEETLVALLLDRRRETP